MDMSGMDMDGMSADGMSMTSMGSMWPENQTYAQEFWSIVAAFVGTLTIIRIGRAIHSYSSTKRIKLEPDSIPSRPTNIFSQAIATTTAILRECTYWQPADFTGKFSEYFTPPSAGRCILLALYLITILTMLFQNTLITPDDPMYVWHFEKIGFRAAWINITQIPFIYLLSTKINPISLLSGISYERLNWLHRWTARTVFITVIFHWAYFFTEWYQAGLVMMELQLMPMVTYGFVAWGILGWQVLTSFGYFRSMAYELWVFQHVASAGVLLWALYMHVPDYATYNIWLSIAFVAFDRLGRFVYNVVQNVGLLRRSSSGMSLGYTATLEALPDGYTKVRIPNIHFTWKPGQHIYLYIPQIGPLETHPFTIANDQDYDQENKQRTVNLLVKARSGFTKRLHNKARTSPSQTYKTLLSGPWGTPPNLSSYETIIFIANSTGATFNLPLFQSLAKTRGCAKNVVFSWICRESCQISWFQNQILDASEEITANGAKVSVRIGCTGGAGGNGVCCCCAPAVVEERKSEEEEELIQEPVSSCCKAPIPEALKKDAITTIASEKSVDDASKKDSVTATVSEKPVLSSTASSASVASEVVTTEAGQCNCICALRNNSITSFSETRPTIESIIRPAVEAARGETMVVVCGRKSLTADVRNYVVKLSDERAVQKGSGAQGIALWCEEFGW